MKFSGYVFTFQSTSRCATAGILSRGVGFNAWCPVLLPSAHWRVRGERQGSERTNKDIAKNRVRWTFLGRGLLWDVLHCVGPTSPPAATRGRQLREAGSTRRRRLSGRHVPVSPTFLYRRDLRDHRRESLDCPGRVLPGLSLMVLGLMVLGLIVLGLMGLCYMALGFEGPNALQRRRSMRTLCR